MSRIDIAGESRVLMERHYQTDYVDLTIDSSCVLFTLLLFPVCIAIMDGGVPVIGFSDRVIP